MRYVLMGNGHVRQQDVAQRSLVAWSMVRSTVRLQLGLPHLICLGRWESRGPLRHRGTFLYLPKHLLTSRPIDTGDILWFNDDMDKDTLDKLVSEVVDQGLVEMSVDSSGDDIYRLSVKGRAYLLVLLSIHKPDLGDVPAFLNG